MAPPFAATLRFRIVDRSAFMFEDGLSVQYVAPNPVSDWQSGPNLEQWD